MNTDTRKGVDLNSTAEWKQPDVKEWLFKDFIYFSRGEGKEKKRERDINVWLPLARPLLGTKTTTQACVLTGNRTSDSLLCSLVLNSLSHTPFS